MESLKRKPQLGIKKTFILPDGTEIALQRVKANVLFQNANNKNMSETERNMRILAAKMLVKVPETTEFMPIVYDDLVNCFNDEELNFIGEQISVEDDKKND